MSITALTIAFAVVAIKESFELRGYKGQNVALATKVDYLEKQVALKNSEGKKLTELLKATNALVSKQIEHSAMNRVSQSRGGLDREALKFKGTEYTLSVASCGKPRSSKEYGITNSGTRATQFRTVAVDKRVIPIGSVLYISFPARYKYLDGYYVAEDTGSKVVGKHIDVFIGEDAPGQYYYENMAAEFGCQQIIVEIIERGNGKIDKRYVTNSSGGVTRFTPPGKVENTTDYTEDERKENARIYSELCDLRW